MLGSSHKNNLHHFRRYSLIDRVSGALISTCETSPTLETLAQSSLFTSSRLSDRELVTAMHHNHGLDVSVAGARLSLACSSFMHAANVMLKSTFNCLCHSRDSVYVCGGVVGFVLKVTFKI